MRDGGTLVLQTHVSTFATALAARGFDCPLDHNLPAHPRHGSEGPNVAGVTGSAVASGVILDTSSTERAVGPQALTRRGACSLLSGGAIVAVRHRAPLAEIRHRSPRADHPLP